MRYQARIAALLLCMATLAEPVDSFAQESVMVVPSERITTRLRVRADWKDSSQIIGYILPGDSAELIEDLPRWRKVRLSDGNIGFVSKSYSDTVRRGALAARQTNELRIHYLPIGAGTCTLVECPGATAHPMVVDCGSFSDGFRSASDMDLETVKAYFKDILSKHTASPNVVISHPDKDHIIWVEDALDGRQVNQLWAGGDRAAYPAYFRNFMDAKTQQGTSVHVDMPAGWHNDGVPVDELQCGDALTYVLTTSGGDSDNSGTTANGDSLMLSIEIGEFVAVFSGDAEDETEAQSIANFDDAVKTTVLSASHHGAATHGSNGIPNDNKGGKTSSWNSLTAPEIVVYSSGRGYGHPRCKALDIYAASLGNVSAPHHVWCGISSTERKTFTTNKAQYVTEQNGAVIVTTDGTSPLSVICTGDSPCDDSINF